MSTITANLTVNVSNVTALLSANSTGTVVATALGATSSTTLASSTAAVYLTTLGATSSTTLASSTAAVYLRGADLVSSTTTAAITSVTAAVVHAAKVHANESEWTGGARLPLVDTEPAAPHPACSLLATSFGWWLQLFLGLVCFVSLVGKRFTDRIRRPWKVWFMDTSKQGLSAFLAHFLNILLSMALGHWLEADADPCNWYWVQLTLDDTLGVGIQFALLKALQCVYRSRCVDRPELADSGEYGDPPDCSIWGRQLLDWQCLVLCQKSLMLVLVFKATTQVAAVADVCLGWLNPWPRVKLVVVMVITPLTMNVFALWMADNFLQGDPTAERTAQRSLVEDRDSPSVIGNGEPHGSSRDLSGDESERVVGFQEWKRRVGSRQHHPVPTRIPGVELSSRFGHRFESQR